MAKLPKNVTTLLYTGETVPLPPPAHRICPTCLTPMSSWYAWKSSERVIHYAFICNCGRQGKLKILHYRLNKKGELQS